MRNWRRSSSFSRGKRRRKESFCHCQRKKLDHENGQSVSPANSTAPTSSTPKSIAERKPAAGQDEGSSPSSQPTQATLPTTQRTYIQRSLVHEAGRKEQIAVLSLSSREETNQDNGLRQQAANTRTFRRKRVRSLPLSKEQNELCASLSISLALTQKQPLKMLLLTASKKECNTFVGDPNNEDFCR